MFETRRTQVQPRVRTVEIRQLGGDAVSEMKTTSLAACASHVRGQKLHLSGNLGHLRVHTGLANCHGTNRAPPIGRRQMYQADSLPL